MWDKVKELFPEIVPTIRRQPIVVRLVFLAAVVGIPFVGTLVWPQFAQFLMGGGRVQVPLRLILAVIATAAMGSACTFLTVIAGRRRARLRRFVREWIEFRHALELLHIRVDAWLLRPSSGFDDPGWRDISEGIQDYFTRRKSLRRLVFQLGEQSLIVQHSQNWLQLKAEQQVFKERDYLTPFGFLLDLGAPIASINLNGKAVWEARFIADEYIEYLQYKYPFLKRFAKMPANTQMEPTRAGS